jgi:septum formation protein
VTRIEGDHHTVVGVSLPLLRDLVAELGHSWVELWAAGRGAVSGTRPEGR